MAVIFSDDFSGATISTDKWSYNKNVNGSAFIPPFAWMRQELPAVSGGVMRLELDTYNPQGNNALIASEAVSNRTFNVATDGPIAFEAKLKYEQNKPGLIGGFFTFAGPPDTHDEIDFELMSKFFTEVQTNVYINEPLGNGHYKMHPLPAFSLGDFHTYRFEWYPTMVIWKVDGVEIRSYDTSPTKPMALHFNIWANDDPRVEAGIRPTKIQAEGEKFYLDVDDVKVEQIATLPALAASAAIAGTAQSEFIAGNSGNEAITAGGGDDVIEGGGGSDAAVYSGLSRNFEVSLRPSENILHIRDRSGAEGIDAVHNVELLKFADIEFDTAWLLKASNVEASDYIGLIDIYTAYLDRAPDAVGLAYWASRFSDGMGLGGIAKAFFASAEALAARSPTQTAAEMVSKAYTNILDRPGDVGGIAYWVGQLQTGKLKAEDFALAFVSAANAVGGADAEILENKQHLGAQYAIDYGLTNGSHAAAVMNALDGETPGVSLADISGAFALAESYAASAAMPDTSELVVKLVGINVGA